MNKNNHRRHTALLVLVASVQSNALVAQEQSASRITALEEVIVTAQKREASLQDTPIAISSFNTQSLERLAVSEAGDIAKYTPNLDMRNPPGSFDNVGYSLRGMSSTDPSLLGEPTVGLYADGVYIARIAGAAFELVDLERIEVLRGPQGDLYGRNTIGGAINLVSQKPAEEFGFKQKLAFGDYDYFRTDTSVDTGEFAGFSAKLAYSHWDRDGWLDNRIADNKFGEVDKSDAARVAIRWVPADNFTADYVYDYTDRLSNATLSQLVYVRPYQLSLGGAILQQAAEFASPDRLGALSMAKSTEPDTWSNVNGHALYFDWQLGDMTLRSISAYRDWNAGTHANEYGAFPSDGKTVLNGAGGLVPAGEYVSIFYATREDEANQFTQEFQLLGDAFDERLQYTVGLYYFEETAHEDNPQYFTIPAIMAYGGLSQATQSFLCVDPTFSDPNACLGKDTLLSTPIFQYGADNDSIAAYGQFRYSLTDALNLTLGMRYTEDNKEVYLRNSTIIRNEGLDEVKANDSWNNFSPSTTLGWAMNEQINLYGTVAMGYRSGGFNARATTSSAFDTPFEEEKVTSYEFGVKSDLLDQRLRLNGAVFYYVYKDKQVPQFEAGSSGASSIISNAGEQDAIGLELDVTMVPTKGWLVQASFGYIDIDINKFVTKPSDPVTGLPAGQGNIDVADYAKVMATPKENASVLVQYEFPAFSFGQMTLQVDANYNSERYFDPINTLYNSAEEQTLINARATLGGIEIGPGVFQAAVWGRNLADEGYREWGIDFGALGYAIDSYMAPRMYGIDLVYKY